MLPKASLERQMATQLPAPSVVTSTRSSSPPSTAAFVLSTPGMKEDSSGLRNVILPRLNSARYSVPSSPIVMSSRFQLP